MTVAGSTQGRGRAQGTAPAAPRADHQQQRPRRQCCCDDHARSRRGRTRPAPRLLSARSALLSAGALVAAAAWLSVPLRLAWLAAAAEGVSLGDAPADHPAPSTDADPGCGGNLTAPRGFIHSPNFPGPFRVPLRCRWVIDASAYVKPVILVYLTQVYVLNGLNFYAYALYGRTRMGETTVHSVAPSNVTTTHWLSSKYPYLVVDLALDRLEGNHLRVLSHLQGVFGFNLTYEVQEDVDDLQPCSNHTFCCNTNLCSFVGDCFVDQDYKRFYCACPEGHEGPYCGSGPRCKGEPGEPAICRNGGTCRSLGTESIECDCVDNYTGFFCEIPPLDDEVDRECHSSGGAGGAGGTVCNCTGGARVLTDRSIYSVGVQLAGPADPESDPDYSVNLNRTFTRNMTEYLENSNVSVVSELHVLSITPTKDRNLSLSFEMVCGDSDLPAVKDALHRLVGRCPDCLGSLRLTEAALLRKPEPMLHLVELKTNLKPGGVIRENDELSLSCIARGAASMQFSWFKDGVLINASLARRTVLSKVSDKPDPLDQWAAVLVLAVTPLDAGRFTCRVRDRGSEQCRSADVRVLSPPRASVRPLVHAVRAGGNVTTCCYTGAERLGVTWAKNKALLALSPGREVWEDLEYPPGSQLRLYNVQQSAVYTCQVMNAAGMVEVESRVDVTGALPECAAGHAAGADWAATPVGREARIECVDLPGYLGGLARRQCDLQALAVGDAPGPGPQWREPDFSECVRDEFAVIRDNFIRLTLGYANTTALETLQAVRRWLEARAVAEAEGAADEGLRPREGEPVLALAVDVAAYQRKVLGARPLLQLREELFRIVDLLLLQSGPGGVEPHRSHAVHDNVAIEEVQALVREQALLWASSLPSPRSSASASSSSASSLSPSPQSSAAGTASPAYTQMEVHVVGANDLDEAARPGGQAVPLPGWVGGTLRLHISKALSQRSVVAAIVAYKSLHKLLPERSVAKLPDSSELEYELASSLVSVSLGSEGGDLVRDVADGRDFAADVVLLVTVPGDGDDASPSAAYLWPRWAATCAVADIARGVTAGPLPWSTSACATLAVDGDPQDLRPGGFSLRCNCTVPGTIAVLLTSNTSESALPLGPRPPVALVSGLALCALQTGAAALVLLPRWLGRPSCMLFLKLQSAAASTASAGLFLAGLSHASSSGSGPALVAALHCCLLMALAAHLGKLLLLYTELVGVRGMRRAHLRQSVLAVVAGAPLVGVLCGLVAARSLQSPARLRASLAAGWPPWGSRLCSVLVATAALILVAFGGLLCAVAVRLGARPAEDDAHAARTCRRLGLVRRACALLVLQACVVALSVCYVSVKSAVVCHCFSIAAAMLGAVTLLCYVVRPERPEPPTPGLGPGVAEDADAANDLSQTEPLTFFTKQDAEVDSESAVTPLSLGLGLAKAADGPRPGSTAFGGGAANGKPSAAEPPRPSSCTCHSCCSSACACAESCHDVPAILAVNPAPAAPCAPGAPRYVAMCPSTATVHLPLHGPLHVPIHVPLLAPTPADSPGPVGSVLGVGREASLLSPEGAPLSSPAGGAVPLQDLSQRSPNKYLYMRCRPCHAEDSDEYVHQDTVAGASPGKYARTLYHNDWAALGCSTPKPRGPAGPATAQSTEPLRPEPVPCYIRGEPGVPIVISPTRAAALGTRSGGHMVTCKADVEPAPRSTPPAASTPSRAPPSAVGAEDALDEDVLNRISHDLDYLLSGETAAAATVVPSVSPTSAGTVDTLAAPNGLSGSGAFA